MLIFLYGQDSYRRIQKLNEIIDAFRKKQSNLSHERFDLTNDGDFLKLQNFSRNRSIFDPIRLAVLDGFDKLTTGDLKELKKILKANHQNEDLIIVLNSTSKPTGFTVSLKRPTKIQDFPLLKDAEISGLINETGKKLGLKLDNRMIKILTQTFGSDTWGIVTELERMALARTDALSIHKPANNFFQLVNAVKYGRRLPERLIALELLLSDRKDEPAKIFNILAYRLRNEEEANLLADYDVAVKSGKLEYEEVLLDYALG